METDNLFGYLWSGVLSFAGLVFGLLHAGHRREMDAVRKMAERANEKAEAAKASLDAHKVHAAERFATKSDVDKIVDKIDERFDKLDDKLDQLTKH